MTAILRPRTQSPAKGREDFGVVVTAADPDNDDGVDAGEAADSSVIWVAVTLVPIGGTTWTI